MLQVRCNANGLLFDEVETIEKGIARIDELIQEDYSNGEPYEKNYYELYDPIKCEQIYTK